MIPSDPVELKNLIEHIKNTYCIENKTPQNIFTKHLLVLIENFKNKI